MERNNEGMMDFFEFMFGEKPVHICDLDEGMHTAFRQLDRQKHELEEVKEERQEQLAKLMKTKLEEEFEGREEDLITQEENLVQKLREKYRITEDLGALIVDRQHGSVYKIK